MRYTIKEDWLNNYLADNECFVSDHRSYSDSIGIPLEDKISLRFFGNMAIGYNFILVINAKNIKYYEGLLIHRLEEHRVALEKIFDKDISVLVFSDECPDSFIIMENDTQEILTTLELKKFFEKINSKLVQDIGAFKRINKTSNDYFQLWTAENLSKFITFNDIDAFYIGWDSNVNSNNILHIFELKRPEESYLTWEPYLDDSSNYKAGKWMETNHSSSSKIRFRVICYNLSHENKVAWFIVDEVSKICIKGRVYRGDIVNIDIKTFRERESSLNSERRSNSQLTSNFSSNKIRIKHY